MTISGRALYSTITRDGTLTLSLDDVTLPDPASAEVIVRIEAAPINPSDLATLIGPADTTTLEIGGTRDRPIAKLKVPAERLAAVEARIGQSLPVGNEGAGTVIATGNGAEALIGKRVAIRGGGMFADYRAVPAADVVVLPEDASAADGASFFVNPLTALAFVDTARREGHTAIVHTAAASSLGQMLQRLCLADGVPLVNIVRSEEQAALLRAIGARHVASTRDDDFRAKLIDMLVETGATIAFDAIGGGTLGSDIIAAMEAAAARKMTEYSRYGSSTYKQLYVYGALDPSPTVLNRLPFGFEWGVGGWLMFSYMAKVGSDAIAALRERVLGELTTTFSTRYGRTIGLAAMLDPDILGSYVRKATGTKVLVDPTAG